MGVSSVAPEMFTQSHVITPAEFGAVKHLMMIVCNVI